MQSGFSTLPGGFELNPKEIPLNHLTLRAMDRREHEKERASLQR